MQAMRVYLVALGANLPSSVGDPADSLRAALAILHNDEKLAIGAVSYFWTTPAVPSGSGPDYCNAVASIGSDLPPQAMLARLHAIEARLGRARAPGAARWQSRVLDLDLLAAGDCVLPDAATQDRWRTLPPERHAEAAPETLILPHPRLADRGFVLAPLAEIAPGWRHPRTGHSVLEMLAALGPAGLAGMRRAGAA